MSDEDMDILERQTEDEDNAIIFNGLLQIGTEGCSYDIALVVTGTYRIRKQRPEIAYEVYQSHLFSDDIEAIEASIAHEAHLFDFMEQDYAQLVAVLPRLADRNHVKERFHMSSYFFTACLRLNESKYNTIDTFQPFLNHVDDNVKAIVIYRISLLEDFEKHKELLYPFLESDNANLVKAVLQALIAKGLSEEYLEFFRPLWQKFPNNIDSIQSSLKMYLRKTNHSMDYYKS